MEMYESLVLARWERTQRGQRLVVIFHQYAVMQSQHGAVLHVPPKDGMRRNSRRSMVMQSGCRVTNVGMRGTLYGARL